MAKALVVLSDGTGNKGGVTNDTNVWRLYQMVSRTTGAQVTFYDDGVGTQNFAPIKAISGALGWGFSKNVRQAYTFLVKNYEPGDRIYMFGFSRGGYTVRTLLGMIGACGLLRRDGLSSSAIDDEVLRVFKIYRSVNRALPQAERAKNQNVPIEFIGVWDTVDAVGLPFDRFAYGILKFIYGLFGRLPYKFSDQVVSGTRVARQALAIDDERLTFHPNYWEKAGPVDTLQPSGNGNTVDLKQNWFAGVHSNCGGSYPKDGLAYVTLDWMLAEIAHISRGLPGELKLRPDDVDNVRDLANEGDNLYDSRAGLAGFYRYAPRQLGVFGTSSQPVEIHVSAVRRIQRRVQNYAPLFVEPEPTSTTKKVSIGYTEGTGSLFSFSAGAPTSLDPLSGEVMTKLRRMMRNRTIVFYFLFTTIVLSILAGLIVEPVRNWTVSEKDMIVVGAKSLKSQRVEFESDTGTRQVCSVTPERIGKPLLVNLEPNECASTTLDASKKNGTGIWLEQGHTYRFDLGEAVDWLDAGANSTPTEGRETDAFLNFIRKTTSYYPDARYMELVGVVGGNIFALGSHAGNREPKAFVSPASGELFAFTNEPVWSDYFFNNNTGNVDLYVTRMPNDNPESPTQSQQATFRPWLAGVLKSVLPGKLENVVDNAMSFPKYSILIFLLIVTMYVTGRRYRSRMAAVARAGWDAVFP